jgi:putative peptidoglycan lipid II flippase
VLLSHFFGATGIAAGIALGAWSNALGLIRRGGESFGFSIDAAARKRLPRIVAAALLMGGALYLTTMLEATATPSAHGLLQGGILLALIAAGIAIYGLLLRLFGVTGWRETVSAIRQTRSRDLRG